MRPTLRCVLIFVAGIPVALLAVLVNPRLWTVWLAYLGASVMMAGIDALLALPRRRLAIAAVTPEQMYIGDDGALAVTLPAPGWKRPAAVEVLPELDDEFAPQPARTVI